MRNLLIVSLVVVITAIMACATASPEVVAPQEAPTLGAPTAEPTSETTEQPVMAPTAAVEPSATETTAQAGQTWRGITVATEHRCSPYDSDDYPYPASVEPKIVDAQGGIYGPYTGTWFNSIKETDIEHIVARSEAHDSGLCAASPATKAQFASDLLNLTLASPSVNRHQKVANDASEWLPDLNECWYVARTIQVRQAYGLTIDQAEANGSTGCWPDATRRRWSCWPPDGVLSSNPHRPVQPQVGARTHWPYMTTTGTAASPVPRPALTASLR